MDHGYLPRQNVALQTVDMRPPQSIHQPFSLRLFSTFTITLLVALLSLSAGAGAQQVTCTPATLEFGEVPLSQSETQLVILTNSGSTSVTVSGTNLRTSEFSLPQLSAPLILPAGGSVAINVTFAPTAVAWIADSVSFTSSASRQPLRLRLQGIGVNSDPLTLSPASLSFGSVAVGTSSTKSVVVTNIRPWGKTISTFQTVGSEFSVSAPSLPITLAAGKSVTLNVTFTPQSAGIAAGSVFVAGPGLDENIPFTGTGTTATPPPPAQLSITPASLNFGSVPDGTTATQSISLSAVGSSVTVSSSASSSSHFVLNGASFPLTIAAGKSVSFNVAFTPQSSGTVSGSLSFASNTSSSSTPVPVTGVGTATQYNVNLSWNPSSEVMGYNVYRSTAANGKYSKINSTVNPNTAYVDSTVVSGQTYDYAATSVSSAGQESALSTPAVAASVP